MFGGSPHMVAEPPRFAQNISAIITGTGLKFTIPASSTVTAARNRITVILSMNIDSIPDTSINAIRIGTGLYLTSFAMAIHSHLKNPTLAIPSTIIIIPAMNIMVAQLIPLEVSAALPAWYQKSTVNRALKLRVSIMAPVSFIQSPKTSRSVAAPHVRVTTCLSILSRTISPNIIIKIATATICAVIFITSPFPLHRVFTAKRNPRSIISKDYTF